MTIDTAEEKATDLGAAIPLLYPLGHYIGAHHPPDSSLEPVQRVRLGPRYHDLTRRQFVVWKLAHGSQEAVQSDTPWRRRSVEELAGVTGIVDAAEIVDQLTELGLLADVAPGTRAAHTFAVTHRLVPLMLGLGNSAENPWLFSIGFFDLPIVSVTYPVYDLWQWSAMDETLWDTCRSAAEIAERQGAEDPDSIDPERLLTGLLGALHGLLTAGAACLDDAFRLNHPRSFDHLRSEAESA